MYDTKKYAKTYRQKHKEQIKAYAQTYRQKHKEEIKAYAKISTRTQRGNQGLQKGLVGKEQALLQISTEGQQR